LNFAIFVNPTEFIKYEYRILNLLTLCHRAEPRYETPRSAETVQTSNRKDDLRRAVQGQRQLYPGLH